MGGFIMVLQKNGWKNMAKGKYSFFLLKANDGARVKGSIKVTQ